MQKISLTWEQASFLVLFMAFPEGLPEIDKQENGSMIEVTARNDERKISIHTSFDPTSTETVNVEVETW